MNLDGCEHPPTPPASCSSIPTTSACQSILLSIDRTQRREKRVFITWTTCCYWQLSATSQMKPRVQNNNRENNRHQTAMFTMNQEYNYLQLIGCWNQQLILTDEQWADWQQRRASLPSKEKQLFTYLKGLQPIRTESSSPSNNQRTCFWIFRKPLFFFSLHAEERLCSCGVIPPFKFISGPRCIY